MQLPADIARLATQRDEVLDITKDIPQDPSQRCSEEGNRALDCRGRVATRCPRDISGRRRELENHSVSAESGHEELARHLAGAVERDDVQALDALIARRVSINGSANDFGEPEMTLVEYALHMNYWYSAFRLLHHRAVCGSFSSSTKVQLWDEAQNLFVKHTPLPLWSWDKDKGVIRKHTPLPRYHYSVAFRSYGSLLDFIDEMISKPCSKEVFELRGDNLRLAESSGCEKVIYMQLWKLFQRVLRMIS